MPEKAQIILDTRALELATRAEQRVQSHEQICEIRQGNIMAQLQALQNTVNTKFDAQTAANWKYMYAIIGLLVMSLGYFLIKFGLPGGGH